MSNITTFNSTFFRDNQQYSDNNTKLSPYILWRYEYKNDTSVIKKKTVNAESKTISWSNYRDNGTLYVYTMK